MTMRAIAVVLACLGAVTLGGCVIYLNPLCNDQIVNGDETGIDCGGKCSTKCEIGEGCRTSADCDDSDCMGGVCTPKQCDDGKKDGDETDVDCGGKTCRACSGGRTCVDPTDCFGSCSKMPGAMTGTCSVLTVSFAPETRYFSGFKAYALLGGDLKGEGHTDLAVINEYGSSVGVFVNDFSTGAFNRVNSDSKPKDEPDNRALNFGPTGAYPTGGGIADFNGDGHLDVVTADYHGYSVTILLNDGMGKLNLKPPVSYPTDGVSETSNLAVGDLNKDGIPDVIATNPLRSSISVFLGRADGTLTPAVHLPVGVMGGAHPFSLAIADFDGDGNNDVAVADDTSGTLRVRLGHGDGTFEPEVPYNIGGTQSFVVIASDVNLDHKVDLVVADRGSDTVSVLLGHGDGTFKKAIVASVVPTTVTFPGKGRPWFGPYAVAVADINKDGVPDIVTPNFLDDSVSVLLGIGNGKFEPAVEYPYGAPTDPNFMFTTPYGIVAADFNGDGKIDFATANAGSDDLTVRLNIGQQH
jgi:hypothetical protein